MPKFNVGDEVERTKVRTKPLSGKIQVFMTPSGNVHAIPLERKHETSLTITRVLAIVDWTEGDGI